MTRSHRIHFSVEGPGEIVATDNGDQTSFELFQSFTRKAFNGLYLVIVRATKGEEGGIKVAASSEGLGGGESRISAVRRLHGDERYLKAEM